MLFPAVLVQKLPKFLQEDVKKAASFLLGNLVDEAKFCMFSPWARDCMVVTVSTLCSRGIMHTGARDYNRSLLDTEWKLFVETSARIPSNLCLGRKWCLDRSQSLEGEGN